MLGQDELCGTLGSRSIDVSLSTMILTSDFSSVSDMSGEGEE
jgi:hypothetical protein